MGVSTSDGYIAGPADGCTHDGGNNKLCTEAATVSKAYLNPLDNASSLCQLLDETVLVRTVYKLIVVNNFICPWVNCMECEVSAMRAMDSDG